MNIGGLSLMSVTETMMVVLEERGGSPASVATTCVWVCGGGYVWCTYVGVWVCGCVGGCGCGCGCVWVGECCVGTMMHEQLMRFNQLQVAVVEGHSL